MSKIDATEALSVYKAFCKQSDNVVTYLGTARKLHQLLDVPVPNLKHVSGLQLHCAVLPQLTHRMILSPRRPCHWWQLWKST
jgi:hypothetical protein